jgi:hypothetical protein
MSVYLAPNRPRSVTITLWGIFLLGAWNVARSIALVQQSAVLLTLEVRPDPRWHLIISLVWAIAFLALAFALWQKQPFARQAIPLLLLLYGLYELSLLVIFVQSPPARLTWLLNTLAYVGVILFAHQALNRPAAQAYFAKSFLREENRK